MLKKIRIRMTFFCSLIVGCILLIMTFFCLLISERRLADQTYADFQTNSSSLLAYIDSQTTLSHAWLSQMEYNYRMTIDIRDGGTPLLYSGLHEQDANRELLSLARETAQKDYHLTINSHRSALIQQQVFQLRSPDAKDYYAAAAIIPKTNGYLDVIILAPAQLPTYQLLFQRLLFGGGALLSWLVLTILAWFFVRRMLMPIEKNRKKQAQFIASASHELRAPLSVMLSSLSAARVAPPDEQTPFFDTIETEGMRMRI